MSTPTITIKKQDGRLVATGPAHLMVYGATVRATRQVVDRSVITISPRVVTLGDTYGWINAGPRRPATRTCAFEHAKCVNGDAKPAAFIVDGSPLCATCKVAQSRVLTA